MTPPAETPGARDAGALDHEMEMRELLGGLAANVMLAGEDSSEWCWCRHEDARHTLFSARRYHDITCVKAHDRLRASPSAPAPEPAREALARLLDEMDTTANTPRFCVDELDPGAFPARQAAAYWAGRLRAALAATRPPRPDDAAKGDAR